MSDILNSVSSLSIDRLGETVECALVFVHNFVNVCEIYKAHMVISSLTIHLWNNVGDMLMYTTLPSWQLLMAFFPPFFLPRLGKMIIQA